MKFLKDLSLPGFQKNKFNYILTLFILLNYFLGFFIREISNGAGHLDLEFHIWVIITDLRENYYETIKNYLNYSEATFPFFHSFQSIFNPADKNYVYCLNNTILNLFIVFIFCQFLKLKKINFENNFLIILIPFIILLSPWFRSSSYWGMTENFAFFFLIPSLYFLDLLIKKKISFKQNLFLTALISLTLYARQQYLFIAVFHILMLIINNNKKDLISTLFIYLILSIPGFYTLFLWGVFGDLSNTTSASANLDVKNIFLNIPKISSIFFFYLFPLLLINYSKFLKIFLTKKFIIIFTIIFFIKLILFNDIDYPDKGGGYIVKFTQFFLFNDPKVLIFISSVFFTFIISIIKSNNFKYFLILPLMYLNFGFTEFLYQEWFDPFYLFIMFIFFPKNFILKLELNRYSTIKLLIIWEFIIFLIAFFYYHKIKELPLFYTF